MLQISCQWSPSSAIWWFGTYCSRRFTSRCSFWTSRLSCGHVPEGPCAGTPFAKSLQRWHQSYLNRGCSEEMAEPKHPVTRLAVSFCSYFSFWVYLGPLPLWPIPAGLPCPTFTLLSCLWRYLSWWGYFGPNCRYSSYVSLPISSKTVTTF